MYRLHQKTDKMRPFVKGLNNVILTVMSTVSFFIVSLISSSPTLSESKRDHEFTIYTFWRPPFSLSGTIDSNGNYYDFTNARPIECDLRIGNACYMKSKQTATIISPGIIQVGNA